MCVIPGASQFLVLSELLNSGGHNEKTFGAAADYFVSATDYHPKAGTNVLVDAGADLSVIFTPSKTSGKFTGPESITLSANETVTIYYTTDGTTLSVINGVLQGVTQTYTGPISVLQNEATTVLKYFAKDTELHEQGRSDDKNNYDSICLSYVV